MKVYLVGGAVRDKLLGLEPKDKDYVIVGATAKDVEDLINQGYQQVGADFPVFLHPETGDEYALARIERKVGSGYNGFEAFTSPDLTIEDDLRRRDLTINAMAMDLETGEVVDPFNGRWDLECGVLRHVSDAFAEDPLRVLRVARFQARYGFHIHVTTFDLMLRLVDSGELDHLTRERIWVEMEKLFGEKNSARGIRTLDEIGAIERLFKGENLAGHVVNISKLRQEELEVFENMNVISKFVKFSLFANWTPQEMQAMKIPREFQQAHLMHKRIGVSFIHVTQRDAEGTLKFIEEAELLKTSNTFRNIKDALAFSANLHFGERAATRRFQHIDLALKACQSVDCAALAAGIKDGKLIAERVKHARIEAIAEAHREAFW